MSVEQQITAARTCGIIEYLSSDFHWAEVYTKMSLTDLVRPLIATL